MDAPIGLTIAGSDSSGGAGLEADLKTMTAYRVYGTCAVTSITAQNTLGVRDVLNVPAGLVAAQIDAVVEDLGVDAAKTGMLATASIVHAVADRIQHHGIANAVIDPVIVATSGARLIEDDAVEAVKGLLLPLALLVTPNVPEAETLSGMTIDSDAGAEEAARVIHALGAANVLIKGGHREGEAVDLLFDGRQFRRFSAPRLGTRAVHGTGCTLAAAIASGLALGWSVERSVAVAKDFLTRGIASAFTMAKGSDLVDHFVPLDPEPDSGGGTEEV